MNLKPIALIALSVALSGCGNKGPLVQAAPPPAEDMPADAETAAPAETVPVDDPTAETTPPAEAEPAEVPAEAPPATEEPATDAQDG